MLLQTNRRMPAILDELFAGTPFPEWERQFEEGKMAPAVDVEKTDEGYVITAEMPGMRKKDIHVTVNDGILTLLGRRETVAEEKRKNFLRKEQFVGTLRRQLALPEGVDMTAVRASYQDGVLTVTLPLKEKEASHKLDVRID